MMWIKISEESTIMILPLHLMFIVHIRLNDTETTEQMTLFH